MSKAISARIQRALRAHQAAEDPLSALDAARILREEAENLERKSVDVVRAAGMSWAKVGAVYGLTKQGAQQRFRRDPSDLVGPTEPSDAETGKPRT